MKSTFYTVNGVINSDDSGYILPHEHLVYFPLAQNPTTY